MFTIEKTYLTEINLGASAPSVGQTALFINYPQLNGKSILGLMIGDSSVLATSPSTKTVVSTLTGLVFTALDTENKERIYQYPCYDLNPKNVGGFYRSFKPFQINLQKSGILITNAASLSANESVIINFLYSDYSPLELELIAKGATSKDIENFRKNKR